MAQMPTQIFRTRKEIGGRCSRRLTMFLSRAVSLAILGSAAAFSPPLSLSQTGAPKLQQGLCAGPTSRVGPVGPTMNVDHDILLRSARGETVDRSPVWLMRQAGRFIKDFRAYSDK